MKKLIIGSLFIFISSIGFTQSLISVPFDTTHWVYDDQPHLEFIDHLGQKAVHIKTGLAYLKDTEVKDGVIEVDVAPPFPRSFIAVLFRYDGKETGEQVYLRYHKSNQADAVQYDPIFKREATWQLYPDFQAAKKWPENQWIHVKIEFHQDRAKVYFNRESTPTLYIDDLKTNYSSGKIGVNAQFGAYYANFQYSDKIDGAQFDQTFTVPPKKFPNAIKDWQISQAFNLTNNQTPALSDAKNASWENIKLGQDGLLDIASYRHKQKSSYFEDNSNDYIWIRLKITSDREITKVLQFDYTNKAYLYLNGKQLFEGNNSFRLKGLLFRGEIDKQAEANSIYLPLKKGDNEVLIAVSSIANGWGWIAKWKE